MEYKITLKNQLRALRFLIFGSLLCVVVAWAFYNQVGFDPLVSLSLTIYYLAFLLIPTAWVHVEYYMMNKDDVFTINPGEKTFSIDGREQFHFNQIDTTILVLPPVMYRGSKMSFH